MRPNKLPRVGAVHHRCIRSVASIGSSTCIARDRDIHRIRCCITKTAIGNGIGHAGAARKEHTTVGVGHHAACVWGALCHRCRAINGNASSIAIQRRAHRVSTTVASIARTALSVHRACLIATRGASRRLHRIGGRKDHVSGRAGGGGEVISAGHLKGRFTGEWGFDHAISTKKSRGLRALMRIDLGDAAVGSTLRIGAAWSTIFRTRGARHLDATTLVWIARQTCAADAWAFVDGRARIEWLACDRWITGWKTRCVHIKREIEGETQTTVRVAKIAVQIALRQAASLPRTDALRTAGTVVRARENVTHSAGKTLVAQLADSVGRDVGAVHVFATTLEVAACSRDINGDLREDQGIAWNPRNVGPWIGSSACCETRDCRGNKRGGERLANEKGKR